MKNCLGGIGHFCMKNIFRTSTQTLAYGNREEDGRVPSRFKYNSESLKLAKTQGLVIFISNIFSKNFVYFHLVFRKTVNGNYRAFWWVPVTRNILGYSLFFDRSQDGVSFRDIFRQKKFER